MRLSIRISVLLALLSCFLVINAQELDWEKMLIEDVENINPVYMPVVGFGAGYINYMGDIRNNSSTPMLGSLAFKVNIHAFIDAQKYYKFNLYTMFTIPGENGTPMTVIQRDYIDPQKNFRFQTDLLSFGVNAQYSFDNFIKKSSLFRPFVSLGAEFLTFNSKADLLNGASKFYYWNDGTIRDRQQSDERISKLVKPDGIYETDIRSDAELNNSGEQYNQYSISVPFDLGIEFNISNRTSIRLAYSYHFNFTDNIDNVSSKNSITSTTYNLDIKDNGFAFDNYGYTYATLHFDLFSDPKMHRLNRMFLELENFDYDLIGDEDGDMVFDINDRCLHTPSKVDVDTSGCPLDTDLDGVPDYLDKAESAVGAIVDKDGVEIPSDLVWANLNQEALPREEVEMYLSVMNNLGRGTGRRLGSVEIPEKFKAVDADGDGYISFDEVLKTIDSFFDFDTELTTEDIYELNDFFFSQ
jgi:hypothetical protein